MRTPHQVLLRCSIKSVHFNSVSQLLCVELLYASYTDTQIYMFVLRRQFQQFLDHFRRSVFPWQPLCHTLKQVDVPDSKHHRCRTVTVRSIHIHPVCLSLKHADRQNQYLNLYMITIFVLNKKNTQPFFFPLVCFHGL